MKQILLSACLVVSTLNYAQGLLTNLQACYPMSCNTTGILQNAHTATGNALNGTINGNVTCVADRNGVPNSAMKFGGTGSDYINIPNNILVKPTSSLTVSGWFEITSASHQDIIFTKNNCSVNFNAYNLIYRNSSFEIVKKPGTGSSSNCVDGVPVTKTAGLGWHHVVFYMDNSKVSLVVDNQTPNFTTINYPFDYDSTDVILGGTNESVNNPFSGSIDNLKFWNRELTSSEITDLYVNDRSCDGLLPNLTALTVQQDDKKVASLSQNTPNPFDESTTVSFHIPFDFKSAQIIVTNLLGNSVKEITIAKQNSGSLTLLADNLESGVYIYSLLVDGKTLDYRRFVKY